MPHNRAGIELTNFEATMIVEGNWELVGHEPDTDVFIDAAQVLIDTGLAWILQGYFGRTCNDLIDRGYCHR